MMSDHRTVANSPRRLSGVLAIDVPPTIVARPLQRSFVQFTRFVSDRSEHRTVRLPTSDSFLLSLSLAAGPARNVFHGGRHLLQPATEAGHFRVADMNVETVIDMEMRFDNMHMQFSRSALGEAALEQGLPAIGEIDLDYATSTDDIVVRSLAHSLLPASNRPEWVNQVFVDHVALALLTHVSAKYGRAGKQQPARGGLTPRQFHRATEILAAHLDGSIRLEELARECGLSRSHFARAFRKVAGLPPHRWLMEHRLERARNLLLHTAQSLGEVARCCGFADQSHFTRTFLLATGCRPRDWRSRHRD